MNAVVLSSYCLVQFPAKQPNIQQLISAAYFSLGSQPETKYHRDNYQPEHQICQKTNQDDDVPDP